jgi:hypothetical protein
VKNGTAVPRLTLGLPTYNGEEFLAESLDALLAQTFTVFELVISDKRVATESLGLQARPLRTRPFRTRKTQDEMLYGT